MNFQPFNHQLSCVGALEKSRKSRKKALVVMASGLGKTVTVALDVNQWLLQNGGRVLYLCHQNDILKQAMTTFEEVLDKQWSCGFYKGQKKLPKATCTFASFQMMASSRDKFPRNYFDYVVVDESHHGHAPTYKPTIDYFKSQFLTGLTATPDRADLQDIRQIFGTEVFSLSLEEAFAQNLLTPVDYRLMTDELQDTKVLDTTLGKLSIKHLNRILFVPKRDKEISEIIQAYMAKISGARVIIFCPSIKYCEEFSSYLPNSVPIHSGLSDSLQRKRLDAFRAGEVNTILTVDKFNEGIDVPEANIIVFLRSTASRTVYFQQLGRGLRKYRGKKRVLVLDFVANCERLEMVNSLWNVVKVQRGQSSVSVTNEEDLIYLEMGSIKFTESVRKLLDVIAGIKTGYTKEVLIKQLKDLATKLGRQPTRDDAANASKLGQCAGRTTFKKVFGTWNKALEAAGFEVRPWTVNQEEVLLSLKIFANKLGRVPIREEIDKASQKGECYSSATYTRKFGTWNKALEAAGLVPTHEPRVRGERCRYSNDDLIRDLKKLGEELGKIPANRDIDKARTQGGKIADTFTYSKRFGSFQEALFAAGFLKNKPKVIKSKKRSKNRKQKVNEKKRKYIFQLREFFKNLGRVPRIKDVQEAYEQGSSPSPSQLIFTFGSFNKALIAAKLKTAKS